MSEKSKGLEQTVPSVIPPEEASRIHGSGAIRLRKPRPVHAPNGLDINSFHFRGGDAAVRVVRTLGEEARSDPEKLRTHMDLGLTAIKDAGIRPLDSEFTGGYEGMASLFTREAEEALRPPEEAPL